MLDYTVSHRPYDSTGDDGQKVFAPAMPQPILVALSGTLSKSSAAVVERAAHLAAALGSKLVLRVIRPASATPAGNDDTHVLNEALRTATMTLSHNRVTASTVVDDDVISYVRVAAAGMRPTCVFVGADIGTVNSSRTPSVLNQLIDTSNAPLWLVETHAGTRRPIVLAAITAIRRNEPPGSLNWTVISDAARLARSLSSELHVMHAIFEFDTDRFSLERMQESRRAIIDQWLTMHGISVQRLLLPIGLPDQQLAEYAEKEKPQVLVLGGTHYSPWRRLVEYNVALQLANSSPSDLLITRTGTPLFPLEK